MTDVSDQIRQDIDVTRKHLSDKMTALTESARPSSMFKRRATRMRRMVMSVKDRMMATMTGSGKGASMVRDAASSMGNVASETPEAVRRAAIRNPMAVGLIAFGVGWFIGSRMPARRKMQKMADEATEQAKPLVKQAAETMRHAGESMKHAAAKTMASGASALE